MNKFRFASLCLLPILCIGCGQGNEPASNSGDAPAAASAASVPAVDFKKQFEAAQQKAEEERQQEQARLEHVRGLVEVQFHKFDDQGRVVVSVTNRTGKPIDDIRGGFMAEDSEGNYLASSGFTIATPGELFLDVDSTIHHAPFISKKPELIEKLESGTDSVRFVFDAREITYTDGTTEPNLDS